MCGPWKAWSRVILAIVILVMAVVLGSNARAAGPKVLAGSCSWNGSTSTAWDNGGNWSGTCTGTEGIPGSGDDVTLPSGTLNYEPTIGAADVSINSLTIQSGRTLTLSNDMNLTVAGALTINSSGTLTSSGSSSTIAVGGNWTNNGAFSAGTNTVRFNGSSGTQTVSGSTIFYDLTLDNGGATTDFGTSSVTIAHDLTKDAGSMEPGTGTIYLSGAAGSIQGSGAKYFYDLVIYSWANISNSSGNLYIKRNFTNSGTVTQNSGLTTRFNGTVQSLSGNGTTTFGTVWIEGSSTLNAGTHDFTVTGSTFQVSSGVGGIFNGGTASVTFNGSTTVSGAGTANFNDVTISNALTGHSSNMNVAGNWTNNGTFTHNSGTIIFNSTSEQTISGSTSTGFNNLTISSGATVLLTTEPKVEGTLTSNGALKQTKTVNAAAAEFIRIKNSAGDTDKYLGVDIDPGSNNLGSTTVAVSGNQTCPSPPGLGKDPINRCFDLSPTNQYPATIKLYYLTSELNGNNASTLNIYHLKSGLWYLEGGTHTRESDGGDYDWVQVTGVDEYSRFTAGNHQPTLVELASFTATPHDGYVLVEWETASEIDNDGFNLWRSEGEADPYTKLNADLIPAQGGPTIGASYSYDDEAVTNGVTYWYKLEDVDLYGVSTFHGPLSATPHQLHWLYLPLLLKGGHP